HLISLKLLIMVVIFNYSSTELLLAVDRTRWGLQVKHTVAWGARGPRGRDVCSCLVTSSPLGVEVTGTQALPQEVSRQSWRVHVGPEAPGVGEPVGRPRLPPPRSGGPAQRGAERRRRPRLRRGRRGRHAQGDHARRRPGPRHRQRRRGAGRPGRRVAEGGAAAG